MKLIQGDCLVEMKNLIKDNVKVDLVLTDLPYGTTQCKWDSVIPFNKMWSILHKLTYKNSSIIFFGN